MTLLMKAAVKASHHINVVMFHDYSDTGLYGMTLIRPENLRKNYQILGVAEYLDVAGTTNDLVSKTNNTFSSFSHQM